ncbi:MAG: amidohydrolase family protein [Anaerolineaceae bacterium]|nr:amidohydrolase family protein [Anaerolineaceae bacterium]
MPIVDAHAYIGESLFGQSRSPEELLAEMDRLGIDKAVLCPNKPLTYQLESANRLVADSVRQHPDRFLGWVRVDPWQGQGALAELKNGIENLNLNGLLLHPYEELFQISDRRVDALLAYAGQRGLPVMVETGYHLLSHPLDLAELAHRFPGVTLIGTHGLQMDDAGFALTDSDLAMRECPNIIMESSGMYAPDNMLGVVENLGQSRLLFGSHSPWLSLEFELERCQRLNLSAEQKQAVLGGNILKLLCTP